MRARLWHRLAGEDGIGKPTAPLGEFFHPLPLVCLVLLGVNDHFLKGSGVLPGWLTGKLSDFAGLAFFPLLLTAGADTMVWLVTKRVDFTLRRWKLWLAIAATGIAFAALKLVPGAARALDSVLGGWTVADPTDLVALTALGLSAWVGHREIARVPLGRLELIRRSGVDPTRALADVPAPALAAAYAAWLADETDARARERATAELSRLRR
jgi:hypothetical protein